MAHTNQATQCYHCGSDCDAHPIIHQEKPFCCNGCVTVYDLLRGHNLDAYYSIENHPGTRRQEELPEGKFAYLELDDVREQLLEFSDTERASVTFYVPGIHCSSCIWLLENMHILNKGIVQSRVHFTKKEVSVVFDPSQVSLRQVVELMTATGYEPEISLAGKRHTGKATTSKALIYRLGVAGFCFGNIMLLSFPEYLGLSISDALYARFFAYLNLALALPVFFYSSLEYFLSAWKSLRVGYVNIDVPISLGILTLFGRSAFEVISGAGPGWFDSMAGLVFFLLVGKWYQSKTYSTLAFDRDFQSYFPIAVTRLRNGAEESVALKKLAVGDTLLVRNGELIPADAHLESGPARIDYSFVTGESEPVSKSVGDLLYAGGRQVGGSITVRTCKAVEQSYLTRLWNQENTQERPGLRNVVDRISRWFTYGILIVATLTGLLWWWLDSSLVLTAVTSVLIVACPCALALTLPFALGNSMRNLGRKQLYLKNAETIERLAHITDVVFDKTGTITQTGRHEVSFVGEALTADEKRLISAAVRCSLHPLSRSVYESLYQGGALAEVADFNEETGKGFIAEVAGHTIRLGSAAFLGLPPGADGQTMTFVAIDGNLRGHFVFANVWRNGLAELLNSLKPWATLHVLSGDSDREAARLAPLFGGAQNLHFRQGPEDKLAYVRQLQEQGKKVLMVGDGLNDAGALRESDVGISISGNVFHFTPASDAILDAEQFQRLPGFLAYARQTMKVVRASFVISFLYNLVGLGFAVGGLLTPLIAAILMPLSSVSVVVFVTLVTNWYARKMSALTT